MKEILKKLFIVLAILWLIISSYLTYAHYNIDIESTQNFCSVWWTLDFLEQWKNENSCASVLKSDYSQIFWIPTSIFWIIFYIFVLVFFFLWEYKQKNIFKNILFLIVIVWFLDSLYFTYLQFFVIDWFCIYCFSSAVITLLLLLINLFFRFKKK
jgi:uncharacterized membrane protein